jgi:DNA-binding response OmpR family regulator
MVASLSVVVVEDHDDLRDITCAALRSSGHRVVGLGCAEDLGEVTGGLMVDVFLLDLNLPGEDGISLSKRLRQVYPEVGIVMLTARTRVADKVQGYESGADVYLVKPVELEELCAAVNTFARKKLSQLGSALQLNMQNMSLRGPLGEVRLSSAEANMLAAFARAPSGRVESWQLVEILEPQSLEFNKSSLEVRIVRLRKKLYQSGAQGGVIESVRAIGYQLTTAIQLM